MRRQEQQTGKGKAHKKKTECLEELAEKLKEKETDNGIKEQKKRKERRE